MSWEKIIVGNILKYNIVLFVVYVVVTQKTLAKVKRIFNSEIAL